LSLQALAIGVAFTAALVPMRMLVIWIRRKLFGIGSTRNALRVGAALTPTLIFTLVLATLLRERAAISDAMFGGLLLYAGLNTMLPSFILRAPFDVAPSPLALAATEEAKH
jgi:hypothetical protein